jgi:uncharacterized membrane protein YqgA involved in biofilm formation
LDGFWTLILTVFFGVNFVFSAVGLYFVSTFTVISRPFALEFKTSPMMAGQRKEDVLPWVSLAIGHKVGLKISFQKVENRDACERSESVK